MPASPTDATVAPPSLRDQQRAFTRERLIDGCAAVLEAKDYASTTVDDIVTAAGASRATFYLHFGTKRDVVVELAARLVPEVQDFYAQLDDVLADGSRDAMHEWMTRAIEWMRHNHRILLAMDTAQVGGSASLDEASNYPDRMPRYLSTWPERSKRQARVRVEMLYLHFGALYAYFRQGELDRGDVSTAEIVDVMTDIWSVALTPPTGISPND